MKSKIILFPFLMTFGICQGQTFSEWAQNVNWDGRMHWSEYLIFSPRYTGPNAMPVPHMTRGKVAGQTFVRIGGQFHTMSGDQTTNLTLYAGHTFLQERVSVDVFMVPIETFRLSESWKVNRNVYFEHFEKKTATGDLYINTNIKLLDQQKHPLDAALRIGLKTASSGLDNPARFIDSPGYYFDASFGRDYSINKLTLRPFVMLGFYSWQTNDESLRQNDAFLYGVGYELNGLKWSFEQGIRGYSGYHNIGDKPLVFEANLEKSVGPHSLILQYQYGIRDYAYQSLELSFMFYFG